MRLHLLLFLLFGFLFQKVNGQQSSLTKHFFEKYSRSINDSIPSLGSVLIAKNDQIIYEKYFHGADQNTAFNLKSATKSIVSLLAGIAQDQHLLPDLNSPVIKFFPEYNVSRTKYKNVWDKEGMQIHDSLKNIVSLKDILTMRGGFDFKENTQISRAMVDSADPVQFMLNLPFEEYPGETFNYSTGEAVILGVALSKFVKTDLQTFAQKNLFQPLNIKVNVWETDPLGRNLGGVGIYMNAKDLLKIGTLVLYEGKFEGKQIVSKKWLDESLSQQVKFNFWDVMPNANGYGYYWWRRKSNGHQAYVASGYGGQLLVVIPELKMVFVYTCHLNEKNRGRKEIKLLHTFIDQITREIK